MDSTRPQAFLVASIALHSSGRHGLALDALDKAIERSEEAKRELLQNLRNEIEEASSEARFEEHLTAGLEALQNNLAAKAGRELTAAWMIHPERTEIALEASIAWMSIQEWGPARSLLMEVLRLAEPNPDSQQASDLLAIVQPLAAYRYDTQMVDAAKLAQGGDLDAARRVLELNCELIPDRTEAYLALARIAVTQGKPDVSVLRLEDAFHQGLVERDAILGDEGLRTLAGNARFQRLILDAFGENALAELQKPFSPKPKAKATLLNSIGMTLLRVNPGSFTMGSPASEVGRNLEAEVQTEVTLTKAFYLAETEVTQAQWEAVMESNPSVHKGASLPVHRITWLQAAEFCRRLTEMEGVLYRLPTEAEWEYACRAGSRGPYSAGDGQPDLSGVAWYKDTLGDPALPQAVGQRPGNAWGFHDMHGNVYEWVMDYYAPLQGQPASDPMGPDSGTVRVIRGGAFTSESSACRSAHRARYPSDFRSPDVGFRVVREVQ
ncbi:MAG: SUMF1/EgtB/PvdO family nonheme iron enzyme [Planctomycetes bacterium]|nr:SUMF1/EgtB/PvdO family nonheme iron enzyme [Planctomycetota bacterium]